MSARCGWPSGCSAAPARSRASSSTARSAAASRGAFPRRDPRRQPQRHAGARAARRARAERRRRPPARGGAARRVHDVQHVGLRQPPPGRRRPARALAVANIAGSLVLGLARRLARANRRIDACELATLPERCENEFDEHQRTSVERLVARDVDESTGKGRPLSDRARQYARSVEAYLQGGVRPRWMERAVDIDGGIARERRLLATAYEELRAACRARRRRLRRALARARRGVAVSRRAARAHRPAQRVVSDRARPAAEPAHRGLRARRRALLPAAAARPGVGARAVPGRRLSIEPSRCRARSRRASARRAPRRAGRARPRAAAAQRPQAGWVPRATRRLAVPPLAGTVQIDEPRVNATRWPSGENTGPLSVVAVVRLRTSFVVPRVEQDDRAGLLDGVVDVLAGCVGRGDEPVARRRHRRVAQLAAGDVEGDLQCAAERRGRCRWLPSPARARRARSRRARPPASRRRPRSAPRAGSASRRRRRRTAARPTTRPGAATSRRRWPCSGGSRSC